MKPRIILFFALLGCITVKAQFNGAPGNIYYNTGNVGIGNANPETKLHVAGTLMSSDPNFPSINVRLDGTSIPIIRFSRDGDGNRRVYNNAFIGQFFDATLQSYSLGIGTGSSYSGDANANNTVITIPINGKVGVGVTNPEAKLHVASNIMSSDPNFPSINVRMDGTSIPIIRFSRDGDGNRRVFHNAFIGQFFDSNSQTYSLGIGTGSSNTGDPNANNTVITIPLNGNVLIGKTTQVNSAYKLDVAGSVRANEIVVNTTGADFVFENDYTLRPLQEVESFIKVNKHLPEIADASQMQKEGVSVGEFQTQLLQKIEELTLYIIELKKENKSLQTRVERIENKR